MHVDEVDESSFQLVGGRLLLPKSANLPQALIYPLVQREAEQLDELPDNCPSWDLNSGP